VTTADPPDRPPRRGTRSNALSAASFIRLTTVDARVSEAVLEVLEDAGIAAYVEPSIGEVSAYRDVRPHAVPTDALHVDAARRSDAAVVVGTELPGMLSELGPVTDEDDAFAAIVAAFDEPHVESEARWHASEDVDPARDDSVDEPAAARPVPRAEDEQDRFVPPPPPPLPRLRGTALWGTAALVGSFVLLLVLPLVGVSSNTLLIAGILLAAAGVATLLLGMRDAPPTDSGPDDGAVV
jgi:hypothetical protein